MLQPQRVPHLMHGRHEKAFVIDDKALIMSFNLSPKYYASDRDFGIIDSDTEDVNAIASVFDADWRGANMSEASGDDLVWSPGSRTALLSLIENASATLDWPARAG